MNKNTMILAEDVFYDLDCYKTRRNNNVLVVGTSGAGKTRGIVIPNLLQATGSYIVSDPKGNLYGKYKAYLEAKGYRVLKLDFTDPERSAHYNFLSYIRSTQDVMKIAKLLMNDDEYGNDDKFWYDAAMVMTEACIAFLYECCPRSEMNLSNLLKLMEGTSVKGDCTQSISSTDKVFDALKSRNPDSFAVSTYAKFRVAADKTMRSIQSVADNRMAMISTPELLKMTESNDFEISDIGKSKTAVFVVCSDTDRSLDFLVNLFYSQAMQELCRFADRECKNNSLPVPVRFIMDDFATNCKINDFPRMIASIRSRNISTMLMIQAESQLENCFGRDGQTIIGNCDTYVYMGGNDVDTARAVAERCDLPLKKILNMPVGTSWIFRRGDDPRNCRNFEPENHPEMNVTKGRSGSGTKHIKNKTEREDDFNVA